MVDVSPRPLKDLDSVSPTRPAPVVAVTSNAQLANMLSDAYRDADALRRDLAVEPFCMSTTTMPKGSNSGPSYVLTASKHVKACVSCR
jgi:hypothetical protein